MNRTHEFYPMITGTMKTILRLIPENDPCLIDIIDTLIEYPEHDKSDNPMVVAVINELDRQYSRWNKGSNNGTQI